ncbi:DRA protein, partial [Pedionomus torquatus]|nr:DRA protein [Pedionomus torquatus]
EAGEFTMSFNADEVFHVELEKQETVWRLSEFGRFTFFEAQGALQNAAVGKHNLEVMMKAYNRSQGTIVPPEVTVFSEDPVELEDPNVLICYVDKFWPSVISITWLKNGQEVTGGVLETVFYPREDNAFRKFSYLPFVPTRGDYYDCRVEHWGLPTPLLKHWGEDRGPPPWQAERGARRPLLTHPHPSAEPQLPLPVSESTETLVCALGLAVGIIGIIVGTILILKAMKMSRAHNQRDPL